MKKKQLIICSSVLALMGVLLIILTKIDTDLLHLNTEQETTSDNRLTKHALEYWDYFIQLNNTVRIDAYHGHDSEVTIPDTIDGMAVNALSSNVFTNNYVKHIIIPETVTSINSNTFNAPSIEKITVSPDNEKYCTEDGILFDKKKTTLIYCPTAREGNYVIPDTVTQLGSAAFVNCKKLTEITLPAGLTTLNINAFIGCSNLTSMEVSQTNEKFYSENGILYTKDKTTLLYCPNGKSGAITIPSGVERIQASAFSYCVKITSLTLPEGVTEIGENAFSYCSKLSGIQLPDSLVTLGNSAFLDCAALESIDLPDNIEILQMYTFSGCTKLHSVNLPANLLSLPEYLFYGCQNLTSIQLPASIEVPNSLAFAGCSSLTEITISEQADWCTIIDGGFYSYDGTILYAYLIKNKEEIILPDTVTHIYPDAFRGCDDLKHITIPASVTTIDENNFEVLEDLTIYCEKYSAAFDYALDHSLYWKELAE